MGNPEKGLNCIHVAGTNGKGSTGLIIASILEQAGFRVGVYSSPHLHSYCERYKVNGQPIKKEELNRYLQRIAVHIEDLQNQGIPTPSEFEILTALGFQYFSDAGLDYLILEVGMGGLYDTTNVAHPLVSVITGIDFDHTAYLGCSLEEIAANKAGIIKPGRPVVVGPMPEAARQVITQIAAARESNIYFSERVNIRHTAKPGLKGQYLNIRFGKYQLDDVFFSLAGEYQLVNLATALTALSVLQEQQGGPENIPADMERFIEGEPDGQISASAIRKALASLHHPGRLEVVRQNPLVIIDAAHNPQGARALTDSLSAMLPGRLRVLVCGMLDDKDVIHTLQPLVDDTRACIVTRPEGMRGSNWQRVAEAWNLVSLHKTCIMEESINRAVNKGLDLLEEEEYLLVTGSFYVLDAARRFFMEK